MVVLISHQKYLNLQLIAMLVILKYLSWLKYPLKENVFLFEYCLRPSCHRWKMVFVVTPKKKKILHFGFKIDIFVKK